MSNQTLEISTSSIIRVFVVLLVIGFVFAIWQIIASIFMAIVISAAAEPGVKALAKLKIPRLFAATIIYAIGFLVIASVFYTILPTLVVETKNLSADLPARYAEVVAEIERFFGQTPGEGEAEQQIQGFLSGIQSGISSGSAGLFSFTFNLFGGIISSILIFVISFYFVIQKDGLEHFLKSIIPPAHQEYSIDLWKRVQTKLGRWFQGQLVLGVFVGAFMFLALWLMGVKYALTIAFMVGVLEVIPVIGPILGGLLAFLLISFQSPMLALAAIAAYIVIEQLQQHLFLPHVMSKAVGINPILIIVSLLVAAKLIGLWGVILAIPLTVTIYEFVKDFRR